MDHHIKPGSYTHVPVVGYDLLPTFYDLAGGIEALPDEVDGGSVVPLFNNPAKCRVVRDAEALIFHRPKKKSSSAIRQGPYKLFLTWNKDGEITDRHLYKLDDSLDENADTDISALNKEKADHLQAIILDYLKALD